MREISWSTRCWLLVKVEVVEASVMMPSGWSSSICDGRGRLVSDVGERGGVEDCVRRALTMDAMSIRFDMLRVERDVLGIVRWLKDVVVFLRL